MSTISASTTSTTAYKVTADTTGTLVLQTGSTPTTAVTIDNSQNVGVGVTPAFKLDVGGPIAISGTKFLSKISGSNYWWNGTTATYWVDSTGNTVQMALDASGNLGVGVTPSAWYVASANARTLQINNAGFYADTGNSVFLSSNYLFGTAGAETFIGNGYANKFLINSGQFRWLTSTTNNVSGGGTSATMTQAMTLDASGNLGVGITDPATYGGVLVARPVSGANFAVRALSGIGGSGTGVGLDALSNGAGTVVDFGLRGSTIQFRNGSGEAARIDSSGVFLVGATAASSTGLNNGGIAVQPTYQQISVGATSGTAVYLYTKGGGGSVVQAGTITVSTNTAAYNSGSDYRLKDQVEPLTGALQTVSLLKPSKWLWKSNGEYGNGFIAHELAEVCPQAVSGEKDAVNEDGEAIYQGVDTSFLVATLTAAIQEQQAIITAQAEAIQQLQSDVAALKGQA